MTNRNRLIKTLVMLGAAFTSLALAGCCQFCGSTGPERDIVYAFDIPADQDDCPDGTVFMDVEGEDGVDNLGGSGIVDRGGSGIVDRDGNPIEQFCYEPCVLGEEPVNNDIFTIWNFPSQYIVASSICALPSD